jgi:hypothetical protein
VLLPGGTAREKLPLDRMLAFHDVELEQVRVGTPGH